MDRATVERRLAQCERHVALGAEHVRSQRELIAKLEKDGHDTTAAAALLLQFEELQALHIADRDRLRQELLGAP